MKVKIIVLCAACFASGMGLGLIVQLNERPARVAPVSDVLSAVDAIPKECSLVPSKMLRAMVEFAFATRRAGRSKAQADIGYREVTAPVDSGFVDGVFVEGVFSTGVMLDCWQAVLDSEYGR